MIVFRCNASLQVGLGHLMRCRQLALELKRRGHALALFGPAKDLKIDTDAGLFDTWKTAPEWLDSQADASALLEFGAQLGADAFVLDDFRIDEAYQLRLRQAGAKFLLCEGRGNRPIWADILFCAHSGASKELFEGQLKKTDCIELVGMHYALLRDEFRQVETPMPKPTVSRVFVTFGGGSDRGAYRLILPQLVQAYPEIQFCIASGRQNPSNPWLHSMAQIHGPAVEVHIGAANMADLMKSCDLALMAAGTSTLEAAAIGLPMVLLSIAENQIVPSQAWAKKGGALDLGPLKNLSADKVAVAIGKLLHLEQRAQMIRNLETLGVDAMGSVRVAEALESLIDKTQVS